MRKEIIIPMDYTVKQAIDVLDSQNSKAVCITDEEGILRGLFTLGDMRKYIIQNGDLCKPITKAMNPKPITFPSVEEAKKARQKRWMVIYPVVDSSGKLVDMLFEDGKVNDSSVSLRDVPLVIMAGGKGTRLFPYTKVIPKPLIPIGDYTITERIINNFKKFGCRDIYMILNYKAQMIKSYFDEIEKDYNIHFVQEKEFLGTGGGLALLKGIINKTFILSNCDILVNDDLECIYRTHKLNNNVITIVGAKKDMVIPYGVMSTDKTGSVLEMKEKPEISFITNTGLYVVEPRVIDELKENEFIHITDVAQRYMDNKERVGVFPISEKSWLDMGQFNEMERMLNELGVEQ